MKKLSLLPSDLDTKCSFTLSLMSMMGFFVASFVLCSVIFSVSIVLRDPPSDAALHEPSSLTPLLQIAQTLQDFVNETSDSVELQQDKLLGGLLADGFDDEETCLSRYQSAMYYHKGLSEKPSSYLISRSGAQFTESSECKYVLWISFSGLGNRILTLASAFLYALLTNRVLVVDPGTDMVDLFCEPFPDSSWFLPSDFPLNVQFNNFSQNSDQCYGKMLKNKAVTDSTVASFVYLHIARDYDDHDKLFFCDEEQRFLRNMPWLMMKTDNYFVPSVLLMPSFEQELNDLFPNKETVFHFLGRYLLHPTNNVWGLVVRYYQAYLAKADERVGIQIRVFDTKPGPFQHKKNILPDVNHQEDATNSSGIPKSKAVLMTSLNSGYFEKVRDIYWEFPTVTGEAVGVYQPSHEGYQQTQKQMHNQKAWAEMYLLSLTDVLATSSWSTFGYVAHGLGGLKLRILYKPENRTVPDPPCPCAMSMEPCFHAPPFFNCKAKRGTYTGELVPCEAL
ncbi:hypothetical protein AAZV13_17G093100 [Glycine max]